MPHVTHYKSIFISDIHLGTRGCQADALCSFLKENNLFTPLNMRVVADDKLKNITGCYVVNEERLNNMSDATFLDIKNRRYLPAIYAHLTSLAQIERLAMLQKGVQSLAASDVQEQAIVH